MNYDYTFIFAGLESGEGGDRHDHNWIQEVFHYLEQFQTPGKVIGAMSAPGPISMQKMNQYVDAILFNIMPG